MVVTRIDSDYTVHVPDALREEFQVGQEVAVSLDAQGRLIITPFQQIRARLQETFGMWSEQPDVAPNGVEYMDSVRQGQRLSDARSQLDETD